MFDKVQQPTKVVERTYLTNMENSNFIANSWLNRRFEIVYVRTLDSYVGEQHNHYPWFESCEKVPVRRSFSTCTLVARQLNRPKYGRKSDFNR